MSPERTLAMITRDCPAEVGDAIEYNFLPAANRALRRAEAYFGDALVDPLIDAISEFSKAGPATRLFIGALTRLVPSRQSVFETNLRVLLPNWKNSLPSTEHGQPSEFWIASSRAMEAEIRLPPRLIESLSAAASSALVDVAVTALRAMQRFGSTASLDVAENLSAASNEAISQAAILSVAPVARLHRLRKNDYLDFLQAIVLDPNVAVGKRLAGLEGLLLSRDPELTTSARGILDAIGSSVNDAPWAFEYCLDLGNARLSSVLQDALRKCDVSALPDTTCRRIARTTWLDDKVRSAAAGNVLRVLQTAKPLSTRSRYGLLVQRTSSSTALWVGHCGIFVGEETLVHCTTGSDPHAIYEVGFNEWRDGVECWGIREDANHIIDLDLAVNRARHFASMRTEYDGTHNNQKGEEFKGWFCSAPYWEFDCVGFTERVYEDVGGNPTPNEFESGAGWPLTPREQRDAMRLVMDC